jgi:hypothetical protein
MKRIDRIGIQEAIARLIVSAPELRKESDRLLVGHRPARIPGACNAR